MKGRMSEPDTPSPRIAAFMAHWESLRPAPDLLPGRQHFDPVHIPWALPNLWLVEVVPGEPRRYRIRLVGGVLVESGFIGRPGMYMDDPRLSPDPSEVMKLFDGIVDSGRPNWQRGRAIVDHVKFVDTIERAMMPLAADGRHVDMVLSMTIFHWQDGRST